MSADIPAEVFAYLAKMLQEQGVATVGDLVPTDENLADLAKLGAW